jgi:hypothetical protein
MSTGWPGCAARETLTIWVRRNAVPTASPVAFGVPLYTCNRNDFARFYDAELLRVRAHTHTEGNARAAGFGAARELARRQGVPLFELRAALDDFELRGGPARSYLVDAVKRMPDDSRLPELAQALAVLQSADQNASRK